MSYKVAFNELCDCKSGDLHTQRCSQEMYANCSFLLKTKAIGGFNVKFYINDCQAQNGESLP
jgi:hypothetical protein